jgi:Ca2+-binding EF-hand superfamily protein
MLNSLFYGMDANKDGNVTPEELKAFFELIGEPVGQQNSDGTVTPDEFEMIKEVDKNNDGKASWEEMKEILYKPSEHLKEIFARSQQGRKVLNTTEMANKQALFNYADQSKDNVIDMNEMEKLLERMEYNGTTSAQEMISRTDRNQDGRLEWQEYEEYLNEPQAMKATYDELKKEDPAGTPTHSTTGMPHPKEVTLERMYQYMDANKDGKVTPEELKAFF